MKVNFLNSPIESATSWPSSLSRHKTIQENDRAPTTLTHPHIHTRTRFSAQLHGVAYLYQHKVSANYIWHKLCWRIFQSECRRCRGSTKKITTKRVLCGVRNLSERNVARTSYGAPECFESLYWYVPGIEKISLRSPELRSCDAIWFAIRG